MVAKISGWVRLCSAETAVPFGHLIVKERVIENRLHDEGRASS
jgi:hypothetical protein